jgi:hypothetical protein
VLIARLLPRIVSDNLNKTFYRDQVNKTANAIEEIIEALATHVQDVSKPEIFTGHSNVDSHESALVSVWSEVLRRNVLRAAFTYVVVSLLLHQFLIFLTPFLKLEERLVNIVTLLLLVGFPMAILFAWFTSQYTVIRTTPQTANPFPSYRKKPFTGTPLVSILILTLVSIHLFYLI